MTSSGFKGTLPSYTYASFDDYNVATQAVAALIDHGIDKSQITVMLKEGEYRTQEGTGAMMEQALTGITVTTSEDALEGAAKGAGIGLGLGVIAGLASIAVPGAGLVVAGGALATAVSGAIGVGAAGALAGAVTGYLVDQGADENTIHSVVNKLEEGEIVIGVDSTDPKTRDMVRGILSKYEDVEILKS